MLERLRHMLRKEFLQTLRDPKMRGLLFFAPVIQLMLFGYAVTTDVRHVRLAVYDLDSSMSSRELTARFVQSGYFTLVRQLRNDQEVRETLDHSRALAVLRINAGFEADLLAGRTAQAQMIFDGTDSNTAAIAISYSASIAQRFSEDRLKQRFLRISGVFRQPGVEAETRAWFNENLESRYYFVPGVIAIIVMLVTLILTSMAVVREKEIGTIEQIMVTPISPLEFILGKTLPFALIGLLDVVVVTVVGVYWFEVPIRGELLWLFTSALLYLMTSLGLGLVISTFSETQQQAMISCFFIYLPFVLLSGFNFPIANMPEIIQWLTLLDPLRHFLVIIRGIFLKGVGPQTLWPQMLALFLIGVASLTLAANRFRKTFA
jgi:ABC-2 type transport system permease protein